MYNNHDLPFIVLFVIIFFIIIMAVITVFIIKSRKKIFDKEIEKKNLEIEFKNKIFIKTLETQEEERKRIAQDLHDEISSKLIAVSLNLHLFESKKTEESEKENILNLIKNINTTTIETSRRIAHHLFPPILEKFGLNAAIEELANDFNKSKQIAIHYKPEEKLSEIEKDAQLHVYRILQELVNNSIKHGKAKEITIRFNWEETIVKCQYFDDGIGIDKTIHENGKGLGFINIESRLKAINGSYEIDFSQKGFHLNFEF